MQQTRTVCTLFKYVFVAQKCSFQRRRSHLIVSNSNYFRSRQVLPPGIAKNCTQTTSTGLSSHRWRELDVESDLSIQITFDLLEKAFRHHYCSKKQSKTFNYTFSYSLYLYYINLFGDAISTLINPDPIDKIQLYTIATDGKYMCKRKFCNKP